jgi:hypothetical protein
MLEPFGLRPSEWLAIVGGALEILGFALVAVELVRTHRRELGTAGPFQFLVTAGRWIRFRVRKLLGEVKVHEGSAHMAGNVETGGTVSARLGTESPDLGERLRVLESNFALLDQEVTRHRSELDRKIEEEAEAIRTDVRSVRADIAAREAEAREAFKASAALQWWGIGLFVIGAICSAAANLEF